MADEFSPVAATKYATPKDNHSGPPFVDLGAFSACGELQFGGIARSGPWPRKQVVSQFEI